ncbi:ESPR-type extended signal peptide-containing protein, partial [Haemophilus sp. HMSC066D03]
MNKIFKVIWNRTTQSLVVTSAVLCSSCTKS